MSKKAIGLLGGMGPEASVYAYDLLIKLAIEEFHAENNDDFPEVLLYSIPVPDFISSFESKYNARDMLIMRVNKMNRLDLCCLAIACNTAHILLPDLKEVSEIPFISMIDEVVSSVERNHVQTVGILGTPSTISSQLYQKSLSEKGIRSIVPDENDITVLESVIRDVIKGDRSHLDEKLITIANKLQEQGAQAIILGCTELPLVFPKTYSLPIFNSTEVLMRSLLKKYYSQFTKNIKE